MLGMTEMQVLALFFLIFGVFDLGLFAGEYRIIRRDKKRGVIRSESSDDYWLVIGVGACIVGIVLAIIAANPIEKLKERADKIRSSVTAEDSVR